MAVTKEKLVEDFRGIGLKADDAVGLHSSLKSIGWVEGGPEAVIEALMEVVGSEGTILMPTMNAPAPEFFVADTPSRTGIITERLRQRPDVIRSAHPTHSVAVWGKHARHIADGHAAASALGVDSPFHRLVKRGGYILLLGVDSRRSSLIHVAEAIAEVPYLAVAYPGYDVPTTLLHPDGRRVIVEPRENPGDSSGFLVVEDELRRRGQIKEGTIGRARSMLMKGEDVLRAALDLLHQDAGALLCDSPTCRVCPQARELVEAERARVGGTSQ